MRRRRSAWTAGVLAVNGALAMMAAGPASAHVDPDAAVAGPSLAGQPVAGGAHASGLAAGVVGYLLAAVACVLVAAAWAAWRRRAPGADAPATAAVADDLDAELRRITAETATEQGARVMV